MKRTLVVLMLLGLVSGIGCDGDGNGSQTPADQNEDEDLKPEIVLASDSIHTSFSGERQLCKVFPPEAGTLKGVLIWDAPPDELSVKFIFHETGDELALETGPSPLLTEVSVSEAWQDWGFYAVGSSGTSKTFSYVVMFQPD
jgi:hypothetical protein